MLGSGRLAESCCRGFECERKRKHRAIIMPTIVACVSPILMPSRYSTLRGRVRKGRGGVGVYARYSSLATRLPETVGRDEAVEGENFEHL